MGSLGRLRLAPPYVRVHGPSMGITIGMGCVLTVSMLICSSLAHPPDSACNFELIAVFIAMIAP